MKFKKFLGLSIIILLIFIIYIFNIDKKVYYVNISDDKTIYNVYVKKELEKNSKLEKYVNIKDQDYRVTDLINDIDNNKVINNNDQTIQNVLIKADILTLKIGNNELDYKANTKDINELFEYSDDLLNDIEKLFKIIRLYDKEEIYFLSFHNDKNEYYNEIYSYLNLKIKDLCDEYDINLIDISDLKNEEIANNILQLKK